MRIAEKIRTIFNRSKSQKVETIIVSEKQCPHCASRGMFVFNNTPKIKSQIGESNEKHK
jgi:hypothetical protein